MDLLPSRYFTKTTKEANTYEHKTTGLPKIQTHRLEPVLSVTNTKFFPWDIMDFQPDVPMMISHGYAKAMTTNTFTLPTVN